MRLLDPVTLGRCTAPDRVFLGPHVTNLGDDDRRPTGRHVAVFERRASGGCGTIVIEGAACTCRTGRTSGRRSPNDAATAGVDRRRLPSARRGRRRVARPRRGQGRRRTTNVRCGRRHAYPRSTPREVPKLDGGSSDITAVVDGFANAAKLAADAGCDGVEINAGQHSLVRQFLSGLTNQWDDEWGRDRNLFARQPRRSPRRSACPAGPAATARPSRRPVGRDVDLARRGPVHLDQIRPRLDRVVPPLAVAATGPGRGSAQAELASHGRVQPVGGEQPVGADAPAAPPARTPVESCSTVSTRSTTNRAPSSSARARERRVQRGAPHAERRCRRRSGAPRCAARRGSRRRAAGSRAGARRAGRARAPRRA